jgi:hypothetical protein
MEFNNASDLAFKLLLKRSLGEEQREENVNEKFIPSHSFL